MFFPPEIWINPQRKVSRECIFFQGHFAGLHQSWVMEMNGAFLQKCLNSDLVFSALSLVFCCVKLFWFTAESISMKRCCGRKDVWKSMRLVLRTLGKPIAGLTQKCSRLILCEEGEARLGMGGRQRQNSGNVFCKLFSWWHMNMNITEVVLGMWSYWINRSIQIMKQVYQWRSTQVFCSLGARGSGSISLLWALAPVYATATLQCGDRERTYWWLKRCSLFKATSLCFWQCKTAKIIWKE